MPYGYGQIQFPQPRPMPQQGMAQPFAQNAQGYNPMGFNPQPGGGGTQGWANGLAGLGGASYGSQARGIVGQGQQAGFFNPLGSPLLRAALQRQALRTADAQRRRGSVLSQLVGLSPEQQRVAMLDTDRQASGNTADFLNNAQAQQLQGNQDYVRSLFGNQLQNEQQRQLLQLQAQIAQRNRPGVGAQLGQLAGMAGGAFLGPLGSAAGGALGANLFGGGGGGGGYQYLNPNMPYGGGF